MKFDFETIKTILKLGIDSAKLILAIGVSLVFLYCFAEGFSITGLSVSDVFLFSYVAFSFTVIYVLGFIFGGYSLVWLINLMAWLANRRKNKVGDAVVHAALKGRDTSGFSLVLFLLVILIGIGFAFTPAARNNMEYWHWIGYFVIVGFFACLIFGVNRTEDKSELPLIKKGGFILLTAIASLILFRPHLLDLTMSQMGIRSRSSDVILLDSESYKKAVFVAKLHRIPLTTCQVPGESTWIVKNLSVVWNAFGDKSYLEIFQVNPTTDERYNAKQFFIPKTGVDMTRGGSRDLKCTWSDIK